MSKNIQGCQDLHFLIRSLLNNFKNKKYCGPEIFNSIFTGNKKSFEFNYKNYDARVND